MAGSRSARGKSVVDKSRRELYDALTVGDIRFATEKVRAFFDTQSAEDNGFSPEDVVACVVDAFAEYRELTALERRLPSYA